jgi:hypothetical protein
MEIKRSSTTEFHRTIAGKPMEGEIDDDLGFQDQVASWAWVEALDPDMESWIQTLGDSSHVVVEVTPGIPGLGGLVQFLRTSVNR